MHLRAKMEKDTGDKTQKYKLKGQIRIKPKKISGDKVRVHKGTHYEKLCILADFDLRYLRH